MRLTQLDADHRGDALPHVLSGQRLGLLFKKVVRVRIIVDRPGQRGLEPDQMSATLPCIDVVRERENVFGISVVVLKRHFQDHVRLLYLDKDRLVQRGFGLVQVLHERPRLPLPRTAPGLLRAQDVEAPVHEPPKERQVLPFGQRLVSALLHLGERKVGEAPDEVGRQDPIDASLAALDVQ